jgi:hypothetical protein
MRYLDVDRIIEKRHDEKDEPVGLAKSNDAQVILKDIFGTPVTRKGLVISTQVMPQLVKWDYDSISSELYGNKPTINSKEFVKVYDQKL